VLGHSAKGLIVLKATTNLGPYNSERRRDGAVVYDGGIPDVFEYPTVIEPRDIETIEYAKVRSRIGDMPPNFQKELVEATQFNILIDDAAKQVIYDLIGVRRPDPI